MCSLHGKTENKCIPYLDKLNVCLLSLEHVLAGEAGPILVQVHHNLGLKRINERPTSFIEKGLDGSDISFRCGLRYL